MKEFPFPNKIESREELKRDVLYRKIPIQDIGRIADNAWNTGVREAQRCLTKYPGLDIRQMIEQEQLTIQTEVKDNISGKQRYFSEYYSGRKTIILYSLSIGKWAESNSLDYEEAEDLLISHEFYHHLECNVLGLTSKQFKVPTLRIGPLILAKSGILALSEIGAHGFVRTMYEKNGAF